MKFIATYTFTLLFSQICFSQTTDTIRIYNYLKPGDSWVLKIKNNKSFTLYSNNLFETGKITIDGQCKIGDSTIQFLCDTSKLKSKYLAREELKKISNLPYIILGNRFTTRRSFFIPHNINHNLTDSFKMPKGIFARYYRGDGFSSNIIELKEDKTYIIYDNSCVARFKEEGVWTINDDIITFLPREKEWTRLEWFTKDKKLYITEDYLIGKITSKKITKSKPTIVTETFSFLSKQPQYLGD